MREGTVAPVDPIELAPLNGLYYHAWRLAAELNQATLYDCYYLAAAEPFGCELWTADRRLYADCHASLPWVRLLGEPSA